MRIENLNRNQVRGPFLRRKNFRLPRRNMQNGTFSRIIRAKRQIHLRGQKMIDLPQLRFQYLWFIGLPQNLQGDISQSIDKPDSRIIRAYSISRIRQG